MELLTNLTSWLTPTTLFLLLNFTIGTIFFTNRFGSKKNHPPLQDGFGSHPPATLARAPSFTDRVKSSINYHFYNSPPTESEIHLSGSDPHPSLLERVKSFNMPSFKFSQQNSDGDYAAHEIQTRSDETKRVDPIDISRSEIHEDEKPTEAPSLLQRVKSIKLSSLYRSEPDPNPEEEKPTMTVKKKKKKTVKKMTKSASEKVGVGYTGGEEEKETVEAVEKRRPETTRVERTTSIGDGDGEEGVDDKASDFINKFKQQLKLQRLESFLRYREMLKNE